MYSGIQIIYINVIVLKFAGEAAKANKKAWTDTGGQACQKVHITSKTGSYRKKQFYIYNNLNTNYYWPLNLNLPRG